MNIIQQFKDPDGNNIYPIAYVNGGMKMDLLWTNPSPTSAFAAQTVSLDLSNYDLVLIVVRSDNEWSFCDVAIGIKGIEAFAQAVYPRGMRRNYTATNNGVTFSTGYRTSDNSTNTIYCIPYQIYGIKMTYVVPTEVQGLEYEEI